MYIPPATHLATVYLMASSGEERVLAASHHCGVVERVWYEPRSIEGPFINSARCHALLTNSITGYGLSPTVLTPPDPSTLSVRVKTILIPTHPLVTIFRNFPTNKPRAMFMRTHAPLHAHMNVFAHTRARFDLHWVCACVCPCTRTHKTSYRHAIHNVYMHIHHTRTYICSLTAVSVHGYTNTIRTYARIYTNTMSVHASIQMSLMLMLRTQRTHKHTHACTRTCNIVVVRMHIPTLTNIRVSIKTHVAPCCVCTPIPLHARMYAYAHASTQHKYKMFMITSTATCKHIRVLEQTWSSRKLHPHTWLIRITGGFLAVFLISTAIELRT